MSTGTRWAAVLLTALMQGEGQPTAESLDAGLDAAEALLDAGELDAAAAELRALAEEHADTEHVLMEAHRIVGGLRRCVFSSTHEVPPVEELMSGDILSYDARTGRIKVRYRRDEEAYERWLAEQEDDEDETSRIIREMLAVMGFAGGSVSAGDFSWWNGVPMHPIHFAGPYTVEIKGTMPLEEDKTAALYATPEVVIACGEEGYYRIRYGYPLHGGVGWYATPSLHHVRGATSELMDEDDETPLKHGRTYSVKVNVSSRSITASANGRSVVKCRKQGDT